MKKLEELTDLYKTMKADYEDSLVKGAMDWEQNYAKDFLNAPSSVQFVKMMAVMEQPIGLEMYERALKDGPEYFPEEIEYRSKWALIPKEVKDAYSKESPLWKLDVDDNAPDEVKHWPGFLGATDHDWKVRGVWYASDEYKANEKRREQQEIECYNRHFGEYGLTK